ncbi:MAG: phospholipase D-like domain-containing protein [Thermoplasmata archaeon]|nr:phospholipase D-like domain-containing protein [Thermoplasmata archaeon]
MKKIYGLLMLLCFVAGFITAQYLATLNRPESTNLPENYTAIVMNDRQYYQAAFDLLQSANKSIHMTMYVIFWYEDNNEIKNLVNILVAKAKAGLDVKVFLDTDPSNQMVTGNNTLTAQYLMNNGVKVKFDSPSVTTHTKLIIIDSKIVIVGSTNWSYSAVNRNHEANLSIADEKLAEKYEEYFSALWGS